MCARINTYRNESITKTPVNVPVHGLSSVGSGTIRYRSYVSSSGNISGQVLIRTLNSLSTGNRRRCRVFGQDRATVSRGTTVSSHRTAVLSLSPVSVASPASLSVPTTGVTLQNNASSQFVGWLRSELCGNSKKQTVMYICAGPLRDVDCPPLFWPTPSSLAFDCSR